MFKVSEYRWLPRPEAKHVVHNVLQPAIRFLKKDCLDLPPITFIDREAPMTAQQKGFYKLLGKQLLIEAAGEEISAVNAAVKLNKLLQIACGSVYTDNGEIVDFDASNRLRVVQEVVEETNNKVLVFVPFTHSLDMLKRHMDKEGITSEIINGSVSANARADIVNRFQNQDTTKVLLIQPQAASHGLTLTAADTVIWYAPCTSVETYLQANARIDRPGQRNNMTVVHIYGSSVEERMYKLLRSNISNHQQIVELYKQELAEI